MVDTICGAFDQSSVTGWGVQNPRPGSLHKSGFWELPTGPDREGEMFFALYQNVRRLVEREKITHIYGEQTFAATPIVRKGKVIFRNKAEDFFQQFNLTGILMMVAAEYRIPYYQVNIADWRHHFIKVRNAPHHIRDPQARRDWLKDEVVRECQRRGYDVTNDNEGDALGILHYAIHCHEAPRETKGALL